MHHHPTQIWGNTLPSDVLSQNNPPTRGNRLPNGRIVCGCGQEVDDNGSNGLKPSCNFCWSAIEVPAQS